MSQKHKLEVFADLEEVRRLGPWISARLRSSLTQSQIASVMPTIELVVQELAVNIVTHGYRATESGSIGVEVKVSPETIDLYFTDTGSAYDPEAVALPCIEDLQVGGYGVMIIKRLTTGFDLERTDGINHTHLKFGVPPPKSADCNGANR